MFGKSKEVHEGEKALITLDKMVSLIVWLQISWQNFINFINVLKVLFITIFSYQYIGN